MREGKVKISICVIAYRQEKTIGQTLDSILNQIGDFDLEVIVGEDHSPDGTRAVCEEYAIGQQSKFGSQRVVVLLPDEPNMGIMANVARVMTAATGDYLGLLAGDDYWCDEYKIMKQLAYFKAHQDCGVCFTDGYRLLVKQNKLVSGIIPHPLAIDGNESQYFFNISFKGGPYLLPLSMLVRKEMMQYVDFEEYIKRQFPTEDYPMQAVWSKHTKFGVLPEKTVVYRVYKESATFIGPEHPKYLWYHKGLMNIRRYLNELFPDDVVFDEAYCIDYEFWKEFLLYVYQFDYDKACEISVKLNGKQRNGKQARKVTGNRVIFYGFCCYKRLIDIKQKWNK